MTMSARISSAVHGEGLADLATATIVTVQTAKPVRSKPSSHRRDTSSDSASSTLESHKSPRAGSRVIPPPTPPPNAALPPTPNRGSSAQWSTLPHDPASHQRLLGLGVEGLDAMNVASMQKSAAFKSRQQQLFFLKTQGIDSEGRLMTLSFSTPELSGTPGSPMNTESCSEASTPLTESHSPSPSKSSFDRNKLKEEAIKRLAKQEVALQHLRNLSSSFNEEPTPPVSPDLVKLPELTTDKSLPTWTLIPAPSLMRVASENQLLSRIPENPEESEEQQTPVRPSSRDRAMEFLVMSGKLSRALDPHHSRPSSSDSDSSSNTNNNNNKRDDLSLTVRAMANAPTTPKHKASRFDHDSEPVKTVEVEEIRALRYALRFALEEVDRTNRLLQDAKNEKAKFERELKMTQSNLLFAEAQTSLMQEEAALTRKTVNSTNLAATCDLQHFAARPASLAGSVAGGAKPVSIASLRKAKAAADPRREQRYVPRSQANQEKSEDDDEGDFAIRKPVTKQVSLGDFLESSRMSKEEMKKAASLIPDMVTKTLMVGSSPVESRSGLFKSLTNRRKNTWMLELPKKSASLRGRKSSSKFEELIIEDSSNPSTMQCEREQMQREVEDLTVSLFSETNTMLAFERNRNADLARRLEDLERRMASESHISHDSAALASSADIPFTRAPMRRKRPPSAQGFVTSAESPKVRYSDALE